MAQAAALIGPNGLTLLTLLAAALPVALGWRGLAAASALLAARRGSACGGWASLTRPISR